jgi:hypothetical protein
MLPTAALPTEAPPPRYKGTGFAYLFQKLYSYPIHHNSEVLIQMQDDKLLPIPRFNKRLTA